jgi:hypothetical protein
LYGLHEDFWVNPIFLQVVFLQYPFEYFRGILKRLRVLDGIYIMLYVCSSLKKYHEFREHFQKTHDHIIDLSKVPSANLANECDSITGHHSKCSVFIGYLEPGWMLTPTEQTRMRKLIRLFDVAVVSYFPESLPFSWKNEINTFYTDRPLNQNGNSSSLNDGSSIQDQSSV